MKKLPSSAPGVAESSQHDYQTPRQMRLSGFSWEICGASLYERICLEIFKFRTWGTDLIGGRRDNSLGVTLNKCLIWTPHIRRIKKKLRWFVNIVRMITGTSWQSSVKAIVRFYGVLFVCLLRYRIPAPDNLSRSHFKYLESDEVQALRACVELPKCTSYVWTLYEDKALWHAIRRSQETLRVHLRHLARHGRHVLAQESKRGERAAIFASGNPAWNYYTNLIVIGPNSMD